MLKVPRIGLEIDIELELFDGNDKFLLGLSLLKLLCSVIDGLNEKNYIAEHVKANNVSLKP